MPAHKETRILPYTAEQLFDLVMDIEKYPQFLPWCQGARINKRKSNYLEADVIVGFKIYREVFSSRVHMIRPNAIDVEYMKGPMSHLHNKWVFTDLKNDRCEVDFFVDFELKAKLLEGVVDQFFQMALTKMIGAFETRAKEIYG